MKIALCLRGITYVENYIHAHGLPLYNIDFRDTYPSIKNNILDVYDTDVFITTYNSPLKEILLKSYTPKDFKFTEYKQVPMNNTVEAVSANIYFNQVLDLIGMVEKYETEQNIKYDACIITRSDLYFYQKLSDLNIDFNVFNFPFWHMNRTIFSSEDNFIIVPRNKLDLLKEILYNIKKGIYDSIDESLVGKVISLHQLGKFLLDKGETIKYLFGEKGDGAYDYPIYKFGRHIFGNAKKFNSISENIAVPLNRIYHSEEEQKNPQPIYLKI